MHINMFLTIDVLSIMLDSISLISVLYMIYSDFPLLQKSKYGTILMILEHVTIHATD